MGVSSLDDEKDNNLSLAIGGMTYGISPLEMAAAYAMAANDGVYVEPTFYTKVVDSEGNIVIKPQYYSVHIPNPSKPIFVCYYNYNSDTDYKTKVIK